MKRLLLLLIVTFFFGNANAQRYLSPVFDEVDVATDVVYGVNATVILLQQVGEAVPQPLTMDVYTPKGDTETNRPLVVLLHTGNFVPPSFNGGYTGTKADADNVAIATRLAKMGYVVANIEYRLGWNPIAPDQLTRVFTLINAVYRGLQDTKTCARFFRRTEDNGNPYGIDPGKIISWGLGTGGYLSLANATLDSVEQTWIPKFLTPFGPMVSAGVNGNIEATSVGIVPPGYPGFPAGDTLCYPNHVGYSSEFSLAVHMGGSLGDTSWIDATDNPIISFQVPTDPFAPCGVGEVIVPPPLNLPVVEVMGACASQPIINREGLNDCMKDASRTDDVTQRALALNGGLEGFYPFLLDDPLEGAPWQFASSLEPYGIAGSDCDTNRAESMLYIDTIMMYFAPRAAQCLGLPTSVKDVISAVETGLTTTPNPAIDQILVETNEDFIIRDAFVYSVSGELVNATYGINNNQWYLNRGFLKSGMYVIQLRFDQGSAVQKVIFE